MGGRGPSSQARAIFQQQFNNKNAGFCSSFLFFSLFFFFFFISPGNAAINFLPVRSKQRYCSPFFLFFLFSAPLLTISAIVLIFNRTQVRTYVDAQVLISFRKKIRRNLFARACGRPCIDSRKKRKKREERKKKTKTTVRKIDQR